MKRIELNCDFIQGYIRDAHYELKLSDDEYKEFMDLSKEEQIKWIKEGNFVIDDYCIESYLLSDNYEVF